MNSTHENTARPLRTVAGVPTAYAGQVIPLLQDRLVTMLDLELTLKHVHWNVTGPNFIAVHEMLDEFVAVVRPMVDAIAERIRTMGGTPNGLPGTLVETRDWEDYPLGEAPSEAHLRALDDVFEHVVLNHRRATVKAGNLDPVTEDLLIGQIAELEQRQWFVRSFLKGTQPDAAASFGVSGRGPTPEESAAAERHDELPDGTAEAYRHTTEIGADVYDSDGSRP